MCGPAGDYWWNRAVVWHPKVVARQLAGEAKSDEGLADMGMRLARFPLCRGSTIMTRAACRRTT